MSKALWTHDILKEDDAQAGSGRGADDTAGACPLAVRDLTVAYQQKPVLWDVDLHIPPGTLAAVVGPNGAGKSTLVKACIDLLPRLSGEVLIHGLPYARQRRLVGYVPQRETVDWEFPVRVIDVVTMGTYRRIGWCRPVRREHREAAMQAMEQTGIAHLAGRQISELSGGQQQRVFLARALVQDVMLYFMDEPFAAVDAATEQAIVSLLHALRKRGRTCIVVHHDLATVARYFDWVVLLNMRIVKSGPTAEVFTEKNLKATYGNKLTLLQEAGLALRHTT